MCYPIVCQQCGNITWEGCGKHVENALKDYSVQELCACWKNVWEEDHYVKVPARER